MPSNVTTKQTRITPYFKALRPRQWVKNTVVFTAFFFAIGDKNQHVLISAAFIKALAAALIFTLAAGGIYIFNDLRDRDFDRAHPIKRNRPIASGKISPRAASYFCAILLIIALVGAWLLEPTFAMVLAVYVILQFCYSLFLKHVHLLDVFIIALGFVLRAVAGGAAIKVLISPWLIICTFLMALFLGLCKRRHEMQTIDTDVNTTRPSLSLSNTRLLDQLIAITAGSVILAYAVYTQWPETVEKFQTHQLYLTLPFVVFGIFRYLDRVYLHHAGGEPESVLLTDKPLLLNIAAFTITVLLITLR